MAYAQMGAGQVVQGANGPMIWNGQGWAPAPQAAGPSAEDSDAAQFGMDPNAPGGPTAEESDSAQFGTMSGAIGGEEQYPTMAGQQGQAQQGATGNSYGLQSQPYGAAQGGGSSGGAMVPNYAPSSGGIWGSAPGSAGGGAGAGGGMSNGFSGGSSATQINDAAHQAALRAQNGGAGGGSGGTGAGGTPVSSSIQYGQNPDVGAMANPYGAGGSFQAPSPPGMPQKTPMPQTMMNQYQNFMADPSSMNSNPMLKSMMDSGLKASERAMAARGFNGSGNMATELQERGMGIAGQFLPTMANMYQGGAQTEANRWNMQNQGDIQSGQLGLNTWQAQSNDQLNRARANYGADKDMLAQGQAMQAQQQFMPTMQMMQMRQMQGY